MIFNSVTYLIFLFLVGIIYWNTDAKARKYIIFISSVVFYGFWRIEFVALMIISALVDYYMSIFIYSSNDKTMKKIYLSISLFVIM